MIAIVDIDIYKSTMLKAGKSQSVIDEIFGGYHTLVSKTFDGFLGTRWHEMGDGAIYHFQTSNRAVDACLQLLQDLVEFNKQHEDQLRHSPLFVRIGINATNSENIENIPAVERGRVPSTALDIAGKLQKNCPIGKMAISLSVYEGLALQQRLFRPALTEHRDRQFFVLVDRLITPQEEITRPV